MNIVIINNPPIEVGECADEIASLREQLSNVWHLVASVEKERDELRNFMSQHSADLNRCGATLLDFHVIWREQDQEQLAAVTNERDELVTALNDCTRAICREQVSLIAEAAFAKLGEQRG
jgi:septal ring factor EnvC (AmiA/AmiB activator)